MTNKPKRIPVLFLCILTAALVLLAHMPNIATIRQNRLNQHLLRAVYDKDVPAAAILLQQGADANTKDDNAIVNALDRLSNDGEAETGHTLLMLACADGNATLAQLLLQHGADVNRKDDQGTTALMWAVMFQDTKLVGLLLAKGCEVNTTDSHGKTALMRAAQHSDVVIVKQLLKHEADFTARDKQGHTALAWSIHNRLPQVSAILKQAGVKK